MKDQNKTKLTYTKEMLVKRISKECNKDLRTVKKIYNALEEDIADILSSAELDTDISIRLFEGITINSTFVPEKNKVNNLTGEVITTKNKIKPKANITRYYCDKLTNYNK